MPPKGNNTRSRISRRRSGHTRKITALPSLGHIPIPENPGFGSRAGAVWEVAHR
jgi:hypothetical protein